MSKPHTGMNKPRACLNDPQAFEALARRLAAAAAAGDWTALARADADVAAALAGTRAKPGLSASERAALARLSAAHGLAVRSCDEEARRLEARLEDLVKNKEGWMA